jgi:hypothetical protein
MFYEIVERMKKDNINTSLKIREEESEEIEKTLQRAEEEEEEKEDQKVRLQNNKPQLKRPPLNNNKLECSLFICYFQL